MRSSICKMPNQIGLNKMMIYQELGTEVFTLLSSYAEERTSVPEIHTSMFNLSGKGWKLFVEKLLNHYWIVF